MVGGPAFTTPGAFAPTVTTLGGAALEFRPTLRLSEEYSDNFFQSSSHAQDNFRTTLGPGFILLLNGARTFGSLATTVDLIHDTAPDSGPEVKVFPSLNAAVRYALTPRLSLTVSDTFIRNDQPTTVDPFGIRRGREVFDTNTLTVAVDWLIDRIATQAYYRNSLFFNEGSNGGGGGGNGSNQSSQNNSTMSNALGFNASAPVGTDYTVRGGYEIGRTDNLDGSSSDSGGNDTWSHTVFASVARQFGLFTSGGLSTSFSYQTDENTKIYNASIFGAYGLPTGLSLSGALGYSILSSDTEDTDGMFTMNATVSYRFARAAISVGAFQDFRQTGQTGENFGTVQTRSYFGSFLYQITPYLNSTLQVTYSENTPTGTGNNEGSSRPTNTLSYGANLNWQALRWLTASLQYAYTKQIGNGNNFGQGGTLGGDYAENRVSLNFFATF